MEANFCLKYSYNSVIQCVKFFFVKIPLKYYSLHILKRFVIESNTITSNFENPLKS